MKLPWNKPQEERTITCTLTEKEAKMVTYHRGLRGARPSMKRRVVALSLALLLLFSAVCVQRYADTTGWIPVVLFLAGIASVLVVDIRHLENRRKAYRKDELARMKNEVPR